MKKGTIGLIIELFHMLYENLEGVTMAFAKSMGYSGKSFTLNLMHVRSIIFTGFIATSVVAVGVEDVQITAHHPNLTINNSTNQTNSTLCTQCNGTGTLGICTTCQGTGYITCPICNGLGYDPSLNETTICSKCNGAGKIKCPDCIDGNLICPTCGGDGRIDQEDLGLTNDY